jgi:predicted molibdopterin-dependent oxidoreductase YjgC
VGAGRLGLLPYPPEKLKSALAALWGGFPDSEPRNTDAMMAQMRKEEINGFFIMGANPIMLYPDRQFANDGLEKLEFLVVADLFETETTALADVVLPLCSWAEYEGDYLNVEGVRQRAYRAVKPVGQARPGYEIMALLARQFGRRLFESDAAMHAEIDQVLGVDAGSPLPEDYLDVRLVQVEDDAEYPHPLFVTDDPHHTGHLTEKAASLVNFAEQAYIELSPGVAARYDLADGDPVRVESEVGKIIGPVRISRHIENDAVVIPRNFSATPVNSLLMRKKRVDRVKLSKVEV